MPKVSGTLNYDAKILCLHIDGINKLLTLAFNSKITFRSFNPLNEKNILRNRIMSKTIKLTKGYDIKLVGAADKKIVDATTPKTIAVQPTDFRYKRFKVLVEPGAEVKAGSPLMYDKEHPDVKITAPHSGEVVEVRRGEKRVLEAIIILADKQNEFEDFGSASPSALSSEQIREKMLNSGVWSLLRQRPFNMIPSPQTAPKSIFISAFDSAPLAPSIDLIVEGEAEAFQAGLDALKKLTAGNIHLNIHATETKSPVFLNAKGVQINKISGPHPAGNPGVQIHHIDPIKKGDTVWVVNPQEVIIIGRLFLTGKYDSRRVVATTGSEFTTKQYYRTWTGANVSELTSGKLTATKNRVISGNVLTGTKIGPDGHLGFFDNQLTAIPEGDDMEFFGWLLPSYPRPDISKSFPWAFQKNREFAVNTNTHGEQRAFVVTGQYEKVLPMDILPTYLLKSIMYKDIDEMEQLGIYEVAEEDFALCEFVCTSKIPVQKIVREGLDFIYAEEQ